mgnify:CR=1 FL=1
MYKNWTECFKNNFYILSGTLIASILSKYLFVSYNLRNLTNLYINPGSISLPKEGNPPTYLIFDEEKSNELNNHKLEESDSLDDYLDKNLDDSIEDSKNEKSKQISFDDF